MTAEQRLERDLPAILGDLAHAPYPDYIDDVLATTAQRRQRPGWTFPERWLPMDITTTHVSTARVPWRQLGVLALIAVLMAATIAVLVGSRPRIPPPFGVAANGAIAFSSAGDIVLGDESGTVIRHLTSGPAMDTAPTYSPDGRSVAFLRSVGGNHHDLVVIGHDGGEARVITPAPIRTTDFVEWAPDSRWLLVGTGENELLRIDALGRDEPEVIATDAVLVQSMSAFRPPDGRQIMFNRPSDGGLWVVDADGAGQRLVIGNPEPENRDFRFARWSPDGTLIAFPGTVGDGEQYRIFVVSADGSGLRRLSTAPGVWVEADLRWSPDGRHISFNHWRKDPVSRSWNIQPIGLLSVATGEMRMVGPVGVSDGTLQEWSPDGVSILALPGPMAVRAWSPTGVVSIIDVATGDAKELPWDVETPPNWQRLAP